MAKGPVIQNVHAYWKLKKRSMTKLKIDTSSSP